MINWIFSELNKINSDYFAIKTFENYLSKILYKDSIVLRQKKISIVTDKILKWKRSGQSLFITKFYYDETLREYLKKSTLSNIKILDLKDDFRDEKYKDSIIFFNGNDFSNKKLINKILKIKHLNKNILILVYLYDNHHSLTQSLMVSTISDIVVIAHPDFKNLLEAYAPIVIGPIHAPIQSWNLEELDQFKYLIDNTNRNIDVGGMHYKYKKFTLRNELIDLMEKNIKKSKIGFTNKDNNAGYHNQSPIEKMKEWTNFKTSIIVPVTDDLPIRFFDALLTGCVPIVPKKLKNKIESLEKFESIKSEIFWYENFEIECIKKEISKAIDHFEKYGIDGIRLRSNWVLSYQTKEVVLSKIINNIKEN